MSEIKPLVLPTNSRYSHTRKRGMCDSNACVKAWSERNLSSQLFPTPSHLSPSIEVTPFEFIEKLY